MDRWDILLLVVAAYVAVVSLVRLMANRRNELVTKVREEIARQRGNVQSGENADAVDQEAA